MFWYSPRPSGVEKLDYSQTPIRVVSEIENPEVLQRYSESASGLVPEVLHTRIRITCTNI